MGMFSYQCRGCGTGIRSTARQGEECVLIHLRHGGVVGRTEGHYDGYGRIFEDPEFRNNDPANPNGHQAMIESQFDLPDSGTASGLEAWHKVCWEKASDEAKAERVPSKDDPSQGEGPLRPEFMGI